MDNLGVILALAAILSPPLPQSQKANEAPNATATPVPMRPSAEMQKLLDVFGGDWTVSETFEVSESRHGKAREGTASFRMGPGLSLIENYQSNGSAGQLNFLALIWWDPSAKVYRILTCANNDGCDLRGTAKWEGDAFVNSWTEEVDGKRATFKDSFMDISPSSFRLVSEGSENGKTIWRVITQYRRTQR